MKKFVVIYNVPAEVAAQMPTPTPEQTAESMKHWMAWKAKHDDHVIDFGAPLAAGHNVNAAKNWNGANTQVSGFSILQGESLESIKPIFDDHPHLNWAPGCSIDVHEFTEM